MPSYRAAANKVKRQYNFPMRITYIIYTEKLQNIPAEQHGTETPTAASISFISDSIEGSIGAGLGQSVPFIGTAFHIPRLISAEK